MTSSQHPLPGRTRVVETRVAGRPFERTLYVDATEPRACAALWASGDYTQLGVSEHENPGLKDLSWLAHFEAVSKVHLMLDRVVDSSPLLAHRHHLRGFFCNDDLNGLRDIRPFLVLESLGQAWTSALQHAEHPLLSSLTFLGALPSLQSLNLMGTDVEDGCLQPVAEHPTLTHFVCTPRKH